MRPTRVVETSARHLGDESVGLHDVATALDRRRPRCKDALQLLRMRPGGFGPPTRGLEAAPTGSPSSRVEVQAR
jgi:hypothetical protein